MEEDISLHEGTGTLNKELEQRNEPVNVRLHSDENSTARQMKIAEQKLTEWVEVESNENILLCNPCLFDEEKEKAAGFCITCVEYLCQGCCRDHKKSKTTRSHNILKEKLPTNAKIFQMMKEMTSCSDHTDAQVSHKCEDHNVYVCVMCIAGNHRKCDHVTELAKDTEPSDTRTIGTAKKLAVIRDMSVSVKNTRQENMEKLLAEQHQIQEDNSRFLQQLYETLSLLEQQAKEKSETVTETELSKLKNDVELCDSLENETATFSQLLDVATQHGSGSDVDVITDVINKKVLRINEVLENQLKKKETHLKFKQNPSAAKIRTLGHLSVCKGDQKDTKPSESNGTDIEDASDEIVDRDEPASPASPGNEQHIKVAKAKKKPRQRKRSSGKKEKTILVKTSDDLKDCSITGVIILQDGRVTIIDDENKKIKVFSSHDYKLICALTLDAKPSDICATGPKDFAIVCKDLKQIDVYTVADKVVKSVRSWKTKYENVRITLDRELFAVVCKTGKGANIQLRRQNDCKVLVEAGLPAGMDGEFDFDGCSLCSSKGEIIVTSKTSGILFLVRVNDLESLGIIRSINTSTEVTGIAADKDGNLYVCVPATRAVCQIPASDFTQMNPLFSEIEMPASVAISNKKDRMFVGSKYDSYLRVFNLKE